MSFDAECIDQEAKLVGFFILWHINLHWLFNALEKNSSDSV